MNTVILMPYGIKMEVLYLQVMILDVAAIVKLLVLERELPLQIFELVMSERINAGHHWEVAQLMSVIQR